MRGRPREEPALDGPLRAFRAVAAVVLVLASTWIVIDRVTHRTWSERLPKATIARGSVPTKLLAKLRHDGVRIPHPVETALRAMVSEWQHRPDLRASFTTSDGLPDVQGLLSWADSSPDASAFRLLRYRGSLDELGYRLAILPPNGDIVPVLGWTLRNRTKPVQDATDALLRVTDAWRSRPDIRAKYTVDGRVRVHALLFWAANVTPTDPDYARFAVVSPQLAQLVAEYRGPNL